MLNASRLSISLDRDGEEPIYKQLIRHVKAQIDSGNLPPGTRLPASRDLAQQLNIDLAQQLNISRISVVNAYAELRAEGFLSAHAGRGTFIAGPEGANSSASTVSNGNGNSAHVIETPTTPDRSIREMMRMARKPGIISFAQGSPPSDFFPVSQLREAMNAVFDRDGANALNYEVTEGYYEVTEGYPPLRNAVREYVSALGIRCRADQILITGGTQQALDMVVQALLSEGDVLVTENPTCTGH